MADLIDEQKETIRRICRVVENLKKLGAAKMTEGAIRSRLDDTLTPPLKEAWSEFKAQHRCITRVAKDDSTLKSNEYFSKKLFDLTEESYMEQRGLLLDIMRKAEGAPTAGSSNSKATDHEVTESKTRGVLPRIPLPTFDGRCTEWPSFRDLFTSLIIKDAALTPVDKLHYLKTALKGEAALHLKNYATTDRNFQPAWQALQDRYENKRRLVQAQLSTLTNMAPIARESAAEVERVLFGTCDVIGALSELGRPLTNATDWLVHITVERLDRQSRKEWEMSLGPSNELPTFEELKEFLENRIDTMEALEEHRRSGEHTDAKKSAAKVARVHQVSAPSNTAKECTLCQGKHYVAFCPSYQQKTPAERQAVTQSKQLCVNCLGRHNLASCLSVKRCKICEERHHTSLHDVLHVADITTVQHAALPEFQTSRVILSTARVKLQSLDGSFETVRSLIDPASEVSLIAESLVQRLGLRRKSARLPLIGVGGARSRFTRGYTTLTVASLLGDVCLHEISVLILPELSRHRPRTFPEEREWHHLRDLPLADPWFQRSDPVELLLGSDVYNKILRCGVRLGDPNAPVAQETCLGWILNGGIEENVDHSEAASEERCIHHCAVDKDLVSLLTKFWEQEEISVIIPAKSSDEECERHFLQTFRRTAEGRFEVRLPFKTTPELGDSRRVASRTLAAMQRKFARSAEFRTAYQQFMAEYESLNHMTRVAASCENLVGGAAFYLPHHGVWKETSTTTKLRVVFNGSMKTESGKSLNDFLYTEPNLLPPLAEVLLRWRRHAVAFIADVEKMYRQIRVHSDDWRWQRILWSSRQDEAPQEFQLCTVTYGLACAPYLAIRCIHQLAVEESAKFPAAASIIRRDVYVDDVLSGASTLDEARTLQRELYDLLMAGGFPLRKWASNFKELLSGIASVDPGVARSWNSSSQHSVLGIDWLPFLDCFKVTVTEGPSSSRASKRAVLSETAQLFDPLGWLSPVTIVAKILIQTLWLLKIDWDTPLPPREEQQWSQFVLELPALNSIEIPRWLGWLPSSRLVELHGFADASERAYAAVLYVRVVSASGDSSSTLVTAKTKVAPLKQVSIPRLELCAAWLLTRLTSHALTVLELGKVDVHLWSDSLVTLGWIRGHPTRWATYVANRVAAIQQALPLAMWHHVQGQDNPADCASRGLAPGDLPNFSLWWSGPSWINSPDLWPVTEIPIKESNEEKQIRSLHSQLPVEDEVSHYISRFSDLR